MGERSPDIIDTFALTVATFLSLFQFAPQVFSSGVDGKVCCVERIVYQGIADN
jgi:hypothetical protein